MKILFISYLLLCAFAALTVHNGRLVDKQGRERIYHGLNVVMKIDPYLPDIEGFSLDTSFSEIDMKNLQSWGINSIRLGVMWSGVEPKKQQYNQTYLNLMRKLVDNCQKYNISVLVEFHQDLFSEKFCGDGVPLWAIPKFLSSLFPLPIDKPYKYGPNELPIECGKHPWGSYYASYSVNQGFHMLYNNQKLLGRFIKYWEKVVETFTSSRNIIAYELINEPWPGNIYALPVVVIPNLSEAINLQKVYDKLSQAIRKIDPQNPICFQPVTWDNIVPTGFQHPPGGKHYANKSILCYHYYNPPTVNIEGFFNTRLEDIKRLKVGGIMSEMYVIGKEGKQNLQAMDIMDHDLQSWFGWIYKSFIKGQKNTFFYNEDGSEKKQNIQMISRSYAQAVCGKTISQYFNRTTKEFRLRYQLLKNCQTVIYFNRDIGYKSGFEVMIQPEGSTNLSVDGNYLKIVGNQNSTNKQYTVVTVWPKDGGTVKLQSQL